MTYTARDGELG